MLARLLCCAPVEKDIDRERGRCQSSTGAHVTTAVDSYLHFDYRERDGERDGERDRKRERERESDVRGRLMRGAHERLQPDTKMWGINSRCWCHLKCCNAQRPQLRRGDFFQPICLALTCKLPHVFAHALMWGSFSGTFLEGTIPFLP